MAGASMRRLLMALMVCGSCLLVVRIMKPGEGIASRVGEQGAPTGRHVVVSEPSCSGEARKVHGIGRIQGMCL